MPNDVIARTQRVPSFEGGTYATWALHNGPSGRNKRKVFLLIGAFLDAGISDPTIRELAALARIQPQYVVAVVGWLERFEYVRVTRGDDAEHERNEYAMPDAEVA